MCAYSSIYLNLLHTLILISTTPSDHQQLYEIAEQQAGYFTAAQAQAAGFSRPLLSYYTKVGRFDRMRLGNLSARAVSLVLPTRTCL